MSFKTLPLEHDTAKPVLEQLAEALEELFTVAAFGKYERGDNERPPLPEYAYDKAMANARDALSQYRTAPGLDEAGARELLAATYRERFGERVDHVVQAGRPFVDEETVIHAIQKASRGEGA